MATVGSGGIILSKTTPSEQGHSREAAMVYQHVSVHRDRAEALVVSWYLGGSVDSALAENRKADMGADANVGRQADVSV